MEMMLAVGGVMVDWSILSGVRTEDAKRGGVSNFGAALGRFFAVLQGAVIKRIFDPILGQPPDPSRPPTPHLFSSRKPPMASHTPRPPPMGVKVGGKFCSRHFDRANHHTSSPWPICLYVSIISYNTSKKSEL